MAGEENTAESVLETVLGPLERVRPDLARSEARERERIAKGEPPVEVVSRGPLKVETDGEPPAEQAQPASEPNAETAEKEPEARKPAPPEGSKPEETGRDHDSPGDEEAALEALIGKYQGNPKSMAKAIRELRSLQTKTAEDRNALFTRLEKVASIVDRDYVEANGELVLRPEVAARQLRAQRRPDPTRTSEPDPSAIRKEVEQEFRAQAAELVDADDADRFMERMKPLIEKQTKDRYERATIEYRAARHQAVAEVVSVVQEHLQANPEDKAILPAINKVYEGLPEELRVRAIVEEWLPIGEVAKMVRANAMLPQLVREAYELGKKSKGTVVPADGGAPGRSSPNAGRNRGDSRAEAERAFKERILAEEYGLPSIDSLRQR